MRLVLLLLLACAACAARPHMRAAGDSDDLQQCAVICEDWHRELLGIKESHTELKCFCGKLITEPM